MNFGNKGDIILKIYNLYFLLITICILTNCSKYRYITPVSTVKPDSSFQITDDEIRKAFEKKPQLMKPLNVAIYFASYDKNSYADSLKRIPDLKNVFVIPPGLVEGDQYYKRRQYGWYSYYNPPRNTNIKQLRLYAAEGKADLLIFCGITHFYKERPNFLAYSYALLLTAFFIPGMNAELTTEVDLFFVDVRNGLLYATYHDEISHKNNYVTVFYQGKIDKIKEQHVSSLLPGMIKTTREILEHPEFYIH